MPHETPSQPTPATPLRVIGLPSEVGAQLPCAPCPDVPATFGRLCLVSWQSVGPLPLDFGGSILRCDFVDDYRFDFHVTVYIHITHTQLI